jgi:hypothetical protein
VVVGTPGTKASYVYILRTHMKHVVMFSGGVGSWMCAKRVAERHGTADLVLLFTDTMMEDPDLYRFLDEAAVNVGAPLVKIADGRTPWEVFKDERFLGNSRIDPCSKILKRQLADKWLAEHYDPAETTVYVGIDWSEEHRFTRLRERKAAQGWHYEAPLCGPPYVTKRSMFDALKAAGIAVPFLYTKGFSHNNCGGFCIKAGHGHYANLLKQLPERYAYHENQEQAFREFLDKPVSILTDTTGGTKKPLTLREFRIRIEAGGQVDMFDIGGCGCFAEDMQPDEATGAT